MAGSASATTRPKERCGASHWEGATGPSPAPNAAPTAPPSCSPSSPPHASTTSTQKPGSPTSSLASPIFPPRVCTNCCPGNGSACAKPTCPPISRPPEPLAPHHKPASARAPATIPRPCPCEYHLTRHLLFAVIAYRLQVDRFGDLDHATKQVLDRAVAREAGPVMSARLASFDQKRTELTPGTVLVREWDQQSQRVMVMADGFAWNGQP